MPIRGGLGLKFFICHIKNSSARGPCNLPTFVRELLADREHTAPDLTGVYIMPNLTAKTLFSKEELAAMPSNPNPRVAYLTAIALSKGADYELAVEVITPLVRASMRGNAPTASQLAKYCPKKISYGYGKF